MYVFFYINKCCTLPFKWHNSLSKIFSSIYMWKHSQMIMGIVSSCCHIQHINMSKWFFKSRLKNLLELYLCLINICWERPLPELSLWMLFRPTMHWVTKWLVGSVLYNLPALLLEEETKHGRKLLFFHHGNYISRTGLTIHDPSGWETQP